MRYVTSITLLCLHFLIVLFLDLPSTMLLFFFKLGNQKNFTISVHLSQYFFISTQYRFARLEQPSQFNGEPCDYSDNESEDCVTNNPCRNKVRCEGFACAVTGKGLLREEWWCVHDVSDSPTLNFLLLQELAGLAEVSSCPSIAVLCLLLWVWMTVSQRQSVYSRHLKSPNRN